MTDQTEKSVESVMDFGVTLKQLVLERIKEIPVSI